MTETLTPAEARRVFLAAQGLARRRPAGRTGVRQFREYLARQGVLQLDSVNVLARAHYLPLFSRYGAYDQAGLDGYLWGSGETFEHWGHEASVMPRFLLPHLRHRMDEPTSWMAWARDRLERERPGFLDEVRREIEERGPLVAADFAHAHATGGPWWDRSHAKQALEYLFITGQAAVGARPSFVRTYDAPARVWSGDAVRPGLPAAEARQALFDHALGAVGVGTPEEIADHFRLPKSEAAGLALSAVEQGLADWVTVEGWRTPALLAAGARDPGRATGAALLSPFDPVCWYRDRLLRMFGVHYRIEIYTPEHKRQFGYYCHPFLLGDQIVARVDLKADRKGRVLLVQSAWREEAPAPGARRRSDGDVSLALATELRLVADWLDLEDIVVRERGTLAPDLRRAVDAKTRL
ncbi:MAG: YcaQ family DNA glycosylase [Demequinaceae bacterium]|nr:YcaQ family DNA glycosylase [Demequinaceae bacterium]